MARPNGRVGHRKSGNGCSRCKARRVKCDERTPCSNCVRHEAHCSLLDAPPQDANPPRSPGNTAQRSTRLLHHAQGYSIPSGQDAIGSPMTDACSPHSHVPRVRYQPSSLESWASSPQSQPLLSQTGQAVQTDEQQFSAEWLQSLNLMHHYCTSTCQVLIRDQSTEQLWRTTLPRAASSHGFLMHGLLALAALHYAYEHPSKKRRYNLISTHYQNLMLPYFANRIHEIDDSNCEAYFLLATLIFQLSICWIAHHKTLEREIEPHKVAQSFVFLQGIKSILDFRPLSRWQQSGPLSQLLRIPAAEPPPVAESSFLNQLDKLVPLARRLPTSLDVINPMTACILALESLRSTYRRCRMPVEAVGSLWSWPIYLPDLYIEMLHKGNSTALIILAYFAALAHPSEVGTWASQGWSSGVILMVERNLDAESKIWIKWPKQAVEERIHVDDMQV